MKTRKPGVDPFLSWVDDLDLLSRLESLIYVQPRIEWIAKQRGRQTTGRFGKVTVKMGELRR